MNLSPEQFKTWQATNIYGIDQRTITAGNVVVIRLVDEMGFRGDQVIKAVVKNVVLSYGRYWVNLVDYPTYEATCVQKCFYRESKLPNLNPADEKEHLK